MEVPYFKGFFSLKTNLLPRYLDRNPNQSGKGIRIPVFDKNEIFQKMIMIAMCCMRIFSSFRQYSSCWSKGLCEQKSYEKWNKWNSLLQKWTKRSSRILWLLKFSAECLKSTLGILGASDLFYPTSISPSLI
jgi:hypothetical protein